mgnify:FL=1
MSLWNDIKDWFDKEEPQQKPEQPAGEAAAPTDKSSVEQIFVELLKNSKVKQSNIENFKIVELFVDWYQGDANQDSIKEAISDFKLEHPRLNARYIWKGL